MTPGSRQEARRPGLRQKLTQDPAAKHRRTASFDQLAPGAVGRRPELAASLPLLTPNGSLLARLVWQPHQPGSEFLRAVTPALTIAIIVIAAFTYVVLRHAREATGAIEASEARFRDVADASSDWIWRSMRGCASPSS